MSVGTLVQCFLVERNGLERGGGTEGGGIGEKGWDLFYF
jgi:hypothetical protein